MLRQIAETGNNFTEKLKLKLCQTAYIQTIHKIASSDFRAWFPVRLCLCSHLPGLA
jgi:hypothetical protein